MRSWEFLTEEWSNKYKRSINCSNPKGFSQKAHCAGRKKKESIGEGGWDTKATQGTVINPSTVKTALRQIEKLIAGFNDFLDKKSIPNVKIGSPTGSSAYHDVDPDDKIYGDIDLQIVVPEIPELSDKTTSQIQGYWHRLLDEYIKSSNLSYVHPDSEPGHPIVTIGDDKWVQVDIMPHPKPLEKWGRYRVTPERGVKGLLMGNMFSVLGELLTMSIQHAGVQFKVRDKIKRPYATTRKDYELVTLSTDIENFVMDIFNHEAEQQAIKDPKIDPQLTANPGVRIDDIKISRLVNAVKGLANSFEINQMFGKGDLQNYANAADFIKSFKELYTQKAIKDINATKRDKAETPEAKARAEDDRKKVAQGLDMVMGLFK